MIFVCLFFEVSTDQGYQFFLPWRPTLHTKAHKIQLLTYSSNVQRAVEFKLLLKCQRELEKKRELDDLHLMHVIVLLNTISIQANRCLQTVVNREAGKPWQNSVTLLFQLTLSGTTTNKCNTGREKIEEKFTEKLRIGSALRQGKVKTLQHSDYTCNGFAPIFTFDDVMSPSRSPFHLRFVFWWFRPSHHATRKLDDSPQHRNISCNVKQFNVQLELLMFWKAILRNATPFVCTLYHSTLRSAISRNATLFVCTLYRSTLR